MQLAKLILLQICVPCLAPVGHSSGPPHPPSLMTQWCVSKESPSADTQVLELLGTFCVSHLKVG